MSHHGQRMRPRTLSPISVSSAREIVPLTGYADLRRGRRTDACWAGAGPVPPGSPDRGVHQPGRHVGHIPCPADPVIGEHDLLGGDALDRLQGCAAGAPPAAADRRSRHRSAAPNRSSHERKHRDQPTRRQQRTELICVSRARDLSGGRPRRVGRTRNPAASRSVTVRDRYLMKSMRGRLRRRSGSACCGCLLLLHHAGGDRREH